MMLSRLIPAVLAAAFSLNALDATDAGFFFVAKERFYQQVDASGPAPDPYEHLFFSVVMGAEPGSLTDVEVIRPDSSVVALFADSDMEGWEIDVDFPSQAALDAAYPDGLYTLRITGANDGLKSIPLNLGGDYVAPLSITNYTALQAADPDQPVTIEWATPAGASEDDFILLWIDTYADDELMSPLPWEEGSLSGLSTSYTIPAGALAPGIVYEVEIEYFRVSEGHPPEGGAYPGVYGAAVLGTGLTFDMRTTGESDGLHGARLGLSLGAHGLPLQVSDTSVTVDLSLPVDRQYHVWLQVRDPDPAPREQVFFSGPAGSGISNVMAEWGGGGSNWYSSPNYPFPPYPHSGEWSVSYRGNPFSRQFDFSWLPALDVVPAPTLYLVDGVIDTIEMQYRDPDTGAAVDIKGLFDNANIWFNLGAGGWVQRDFSPDDTVIDMAGLNLRWDQVAYHFNIHLNTDDDRNFTLGASYVVPTADTWHGYFVDGDGNADTGGLLGWINVRHYPWIYVHSLGNWVFVKAQQVGHPGIWIWAVNRSGVPGSGAQAGGTWFGWPYGAGTNWVNTGTCLRTIETSHFPWVWSDAMQTWLHVPAAGASMQGMWAFAWHAGAMR